MYLMCGKRLNGCPFRLNRKFLKIENGMNFYSAKIVFQDSRESFITL